VFVEINEPDLDCSTFVLLSAVVRASVADYLNNAANAEFTYENREWRLMTIDQIKSMISEF